MSENPAPGQPELEKRLRESEARHRTLIEQIPAITYVAAMDETSTTLFISPQVERILGFRPDEWREEHDVWLNRLHPDDRDRVLSEVNAAHANGDPFSSEYRMIGRDGRVVWIADDAAIVRDDEGKPCVLQGVMFDITDRKRTEEALQEAHDQLERKVQERTGQLAEANQQLEAEIEQRKRAQKEIGEAELRYRTVADFTYDWEYWQAPDGTFLYVSPSCERITGYKAAEFTDNPGLLRQIILPEDESIWCNHRRKAIDKQRLREVQFRIRRRDGEIRWIEHACQPVRGPEGEFLGFRASNRDVTERKQAEAELRVKDSAIASSISGIGITDLEGRLVYVNDSLVKMWGYDRADEILDRMLPEFWEGEGVYETVKGLRETGGRIGEDVGKRKDGSLFDVQFSATMIKNEAGEPLYMFGSFVDVTEQKKAEKDLKTALAEITKLKEQLEQENVYLREEVNVSSGYGRIVGESEEIELTLTKVRHVAAVDAGVLLLGETGTGKELFARAIHDRSQRRDCPFVKVNCAALPGSLIESELFGHVKGAFTGAVSDRVGRFQLADGGTIFLDEIGEIDLTLQTKLLQVLQEGEFERVGDPETVKVDVRIVAATNRDLQKAVKEGDFRADLYYRLAVFPIEVPPLRFRRDDIPLLVWHFITTKQRRLGKTIKNITAKSMSMLVDYDWPGNVRELENVIERAMILTQGPTLMMDESFGKPARRPPSADAPSNLEDIERDHIARILKDCNWKIKGADNAAARLGLKPSTLHYRMKKLGIERPPRRPR